MWQCANCGKDLPDRAIANAVRTEHGHTVDVGSDCVKKIRAEGTEGLFSEVSGILLFTADNYAAMLAEDGRDE